MRESELKTTLAVLIKTLTKEEKTQSIYHNRKRDVYEKRLRKKKVQLLPVEKVAELLGCSVSKVEHIASGDPRFPLSPEDAKIIARHTGVKFQWLVENDTTKPIVKFGIQHGKSCDEPFTIADYEKRQAELKKVSFTHPETNRDIWRVLEVMADAFGRVAAVVLRGLENGQLDVMEYKMREALNKIYGERSVPDEMINLIVKSTYHGKPTITRPDPTALLDEWETRFKEIIAQKSDGKLPDSRKRIKSLPAIRPPEGTECPTCRRQGVVACKNCIKPVGRDKKGKVVKELLIDKKTGQPVNCKICKNRRILKCVTCNGTGHVEMPHR
jgi:transcriptional regulator with XRE-family HTH domain